jgi:hypothetical protein
MEYTETDSDEGFFNDDSFEEDMEPKTVKTSDFECYRYIPLPNPLHPKSVATIEPPRMAGDFPFQPMKWFGGTDLAYS